MFDRVRDLRINGPQAQVHWYYANFNFADSVFMPSPVEPCPKESIQNLFCSLCWRCFASQAKDIGIVVLAGQESRGNIARQRSPNARNLIRSYAHTDPGGAYQHTEISSAAGDS